MDNIDIEEHDVLDNPRIKEIFPDLSKVKTEDNVDDDVIIEELNPCLQNVGNYNKSDVKNYMKKPGSTATVLKQLLLSNSTKNSVKQHLQYDASNPSKSSRYCSQIVAGCTDNYNNLKVTANVKAIPNKIIIGSKQVAPKAPKVMDKEYLPAVVVLENCENVLKESFCFCDICKILFPTNNSLVVHEMSTHSFSVASIQNKAVIDTESENISGTLEETDFSNHKKHVNIRPKETNGFFKNTKYSDCDEESIQSAKSFRNAAKSIQNIPKSISHFDDAIFGAQCYHCDKIFVDNAALINHLYTLLPDNEDRDDVTKVKDNSATNSVFKCQVCKETFSNETIAKFHKRFMHPNENVSITKTCVLKSYNKDLNNSKNEPTKAKHQKDKPTKVESNNRNTVKTAINNDSNENKVIFQTETKDLERSKIPNNNQLTDIKLYKCINCKTCVVRSYSIQRHTCIIEFHKRFCNVCQQWFSFNNWHQHRVVHKGLTNVNVIIKHFKPKTIIYGKRAMRRQLKLKKEKDYDTSNKAYQICGTKNNAGYDNNKCLKNPKNVRLDEHTKKGRTRGIVLFKCTVCKVCIFNYEYTKNHTCVIASRRRFCCICKQSYVCQKFRVHLSLLCNIGRKYSEIKYFTPTLSKRSNNTEVSKVKHSTNLNEIDKDQEDTTKSSYQIESKIKDEDKECDVEIYKCMNCQMCVVSNKWKHACVTNITKRFCDICKQSYSSSHFERHIKWHQKYRQINVLINYFKPKKR